MGTGLSCAGGVHVTTRQHGQTHVGFPQHASERHGGGRLPQWVSDPSDHVMGFSLRPRPVMLWEGRQASLVLGVLSIPCQVTEGDGGGGRETS